MTPPLSMTTPPPNVSDPFVKMMPFWLDTNFSRNRQ